MVRIGKDGVDEPVGFVGSEPIFDIQLGQDRPLLGGGLAELFR
jgi:hypothetical protein